jgi:hypothetical protein
MILSNATTNGESCVMGEYIQPGTIKVDAYGAYVMSYSAGQWAYLHSAPCLHINAPMQQYWIRKAQGENPLHLGGVVYAYDTKKESNNAK